MSLLKKRSSKASFSNEAKQSGYTILTATKCIWIPKENCLELPRIYAQLCAGLYTHIKGCNT